MKYLARRAIVAIIVVIVIGVGAFGGYKYFNTLNSQATTQNKPTTSNSTEIEVEPKEEPSTTPNIEVKPAQPESNATAPKPSDNPNKTPSKTPDKPDSSANNNLEAIIKSHASLEQKIKQYLGTKASKVGLAYYDIQSGQGFSINGDKYYNAASTVKVAMNMVLFDMVKEGKINIDSSVLYIAKTDYEGGTGILQGKDKSKPIPLQILSDYSIIYSDNIATRMIIRTLNRTEMKERFSAKVGHTVPTSNTVTPNEELKFLKLLYENKNNNSYYPRLIGIMKETVFHDRLDKYVPKNIVAHKIGNYGAYTNDVGIVYAPKPYIIAVYTENLTGANEVIANINKILYATHK